MPSKLSHLPFTCSEAAPTYRFLSLPPKASFFAFPLTYPCRYHYDDYSPGLDLQEQVPRKLLVKARCLPQLCQNLLKLSGLSCEMTVLILSRSAASILPVYQTKIIEPGLGEPYQVLRDIPLAFHIEEMKKTMNTDRYSGTVG